MVDENSPSKVSKILVGRSGDHKITDQMVIIVFVSNNAMDGLESKKYNTVKLEPLSIFRLGISCVMVWAYLSKFYSSL